MNRISNVLNGDYEKKIEKLSTLKNFLINTGILKVNLFYTLIFFC